MVLLCVTLQVRVNDREDRNDLHADVDFEDMDDARRNEGDWKPPASAVRLLQLTSNASAVTCMALMNNGLLEMRGDCGGGGDISPACEYRCE